MTSTPDLSETVATSKQVARRLIAIGQNRLELFCLEVREEQERLWRAVFYVSGVAVSLLLSGVVATLLVVLLLDDEARLWALAGLGSVFALGGIASWVALQRLRRGWVTLEETRRQLREDRDQFQDLFR
jgi:uncharacterized membrane protein YqjE